MTWLASRKVGTKLALIVAALAIVSGAIGALGIVRLHQVQAAGDRIYEDALKPVEALGYLKLRFYMNRLTNLGHQTAPTLERQLQVQAQSKEESAVLEEAITAYDAVDGGRSTAGLEKLHALVDQYNSTVHSDYFAASRDRDLARAQKVRDDVLTPVTKQMLAEIDKMIEVQDKNAVHVREEAQATYEQARMLIVAVLLVGLGLAVVLAMIVSRQIVRPLHRVREVAEALADGDLSRSSEVDSTDEVGQVARAIDRAMANLRDVIGGLETNSRHLTESSEHMTGVAAKLASSADEGSAQASTVSAASEQVSRNIDTVAAGSEEMSASIGEIASSAAEAARVATGAVDLARDTTATVEKLGESSNQIGDVVRVITAIAEQTNLLALNATIEAARAGEAGKGFAVVASEVKDLAQETAKATEDIARRVEQIQRDTGGAVGAITEIAAVISSINDHATGIAAAVEEQSATTNEMSRNVTEAATGANQIAENVTGVAVVAQATTEGATEAQRAASELSTMSAELRQMISRFHL